MFQTVKTSRVATANTTNATSIKAAPGAVYGWTLFNNSAAKTYVKLYDLAAAPTVGTSVPKFIIGIPAATTVNLTLPNPIWFGTGIAYATTTGITDADTTAVALNDIQGAILWL